MSNQNKLNRTIKALYWEAINAKFPLVETPELVQKTLYTKDGVEETYTVHTGKMHTVDHLELAKQDGRLMQLFVDNANALHGGVLLDSFKNYLKVTSSLISNRRKVSVENQTESWHKEMLRLIALQVWCGLQRDALDTGSKGIATADGKRPQWAYRPCDIDLAGDTPERCQAIINSIADACSAKFNQQASAVIWLGENWPTLVRENREYARKRMNSLKTTTIPTVAAVIKNLKKTQTGRISMTQEDLAILLNEIGKR